MQAWTDDRLDDLAATLRPLPQQVARLEGAVERLAEEMRVTRQEMQAMRQEMLAMRMDNQAFQRHLAQIGWGLAGSLAVAMFALVISLV